MMNGITVLSQETVSTLPAAIILGVLCLLLFIVCFVLAVLMFRDGAAGAAIPFVLLTAIAGFLLTICIIHAFDPPETTYKVIIDESVSFQEFQERYEIIDQEGQIYTIKEKD